jgi:HAD superfamily hydrolase (TIGR01509 family)
VSTSPLTPESDADVIADPDNSYEPDDLHGAGDAAAGPGGGPGSPAAGAGDGQDRPDSVARLAAVLWDMDGTLVDTEPYWIEEEYILVGEFGGVWNDAHAHQLVGNDLMTSARYIRDTGGVRLEPEQIIERLLERVIERVRQHIPWRPGARELLAELSRRQVPCALVTMSYQSLARAIVSQLPTGSFQVVVAGDDVTHGKPHPEPYLTAAARLGVEPGRCVAIEDSRTGVASAEAAGVPVLAVQHLVPIQPGPGRTVVTSLEDWTPADLASLL